MHALRNAILVPGARVEKTVVGCTAFRRIYPFVGASSHVWKNINSQTAEAAHQHDYTSDARSSETACQSVPGGVRATTILR